MRRLAPSLAVACRRLAVALGVCLGLTAPATATPPHNGDFHREQTADPEPAPAPDDLLRIWMVYVGQGDGLVIELPRRLAPEGAARAALIVVDAGAFGRMQEFLALLAPAAEDSAGEAAGRLRIAFAVLTHHDRDHAGGFARLLADPSLSFGPLLHNGLATWTEAHRSRDEDHVVSKTASGEAWVLGSFPPPEEDLDPEDLVESEGGLRESLDDGMITGVYAELVAAFMEGAASDAGRTFPRAFEGGPAIDLAAEADPGADLPTFEVLWPPASPRRFSDWSQTINGNSVTFKLVYGDFEMLFAGDHNELSEEAILEHFEDRPEALAADVLKVPHHGSRHGLCEFFRAVHPVVSVASMGGRGFTASWRHPSEDVVRWLGGANRVYHTHIEERPFCWSDLAADDAARLKMVEQRHLLVETDGTWFRVVEVPLDADPLQPPTVLDTLGGDGTLWVRAAPGDDEAPGEGPECDDSEPGAGPICDDDPQPD